MRAELVKWLCLRHDDLEEVGPAVGERSMAYAMFATLPSTFSHPHPSFFFVGWGCRVLQMPQVPPKILVLATWLSLLTYHSPEIDIKTCHFVFGLHFLGRASTALLRRQAFPPKTNKQTQVSRTHLYPATLKQHDQAGGR